MPLQATVESLDNIAEELRDEYQKLDDGTYQLKVLSGFTPNDKVEDVSGLKSALQKERENNKTAARQLKQLQEQFGEIDVEKYNELLEAQALAEEEKAKKAGEWDKLRGQMKDQHDAELAKRDERERVLLAALEKKTIDAAAVTALNELEGNVTLLLPHVKGHMQMVEEDGEFTARVVDDQNNPRVNGDGAFLTVKELVSEMRDQETYAKGFKADVNSGAGTPPGGQGEGDKGKKGVIPSDLKRSQMDKRAKVDFIKEHGNEAFQNLPA